MMRRVMQIPCRDQSAVDSASTGGAVRWAIAARAEAKESTIRLTVAGRSRSTTWEASVLESQYPKTSGTSPRRARIRLVR